MAVTLVASSCSTTMAKAVPQHELIKKSAAASRRRVSFDESRNVEHGNGAWSFDDCKLTWFNKFEYQQMKESSYSQAKQIWRRERRIADEDSYMNAILRVYDVCCQAQQESEAGLLSESDKALLTTLIGMANTRTGLEKMCIREIAHDKRRRRAEVSDLVLRVQAAHKAGSAHARIELVRLVSESVSRPSRLFARHMAQALEASLY